MKRCVIVGGAPIENYDRIKGYLRDDDFIIYCDCGLKHRERLEVKPDLIVGDFDSYEKSKLGGISINMENATATDEDSSEVIELCPVKDDTDTSHAVTVALERGFADFLLVGMTGRRMDHTLGNVYILHRLDELNKKALMADDYSEMSIVNRETVSIDDSMPFFSLINITGKASGITIKNAKYPLENGEIVQIHNDLGVSNEVLPGMMASISVKEGKLLLIRDIVG
ncbi:MAG: thiamine diphosphokinase [Lachnospiraceae bacterium]|nr:thiamine diphosphokinase [Lachnospiraceae bacterium]